MKTTMKAFPERFVQVHLLTSYPPSNLNRDDTGRPKTATMGGSLRLRVSSQSLKRAWRTSDIFREAFPTGIGIQTRSLGEELIKAMTGLGAQDKLAVDWANAIIAALEKKGGGDEAEEDAEDNGADEEASTAKKAGNSPSQRKQAATSTKRQKTAESGHQLRLGPLELDAVNGLAAKCGKRKSGPTETELKGLRVPHHGGVDIAMFGRMLAANTDMNVDAAVQVAHGITVHEVAVEDDYFTAVDDLNAAREETGAGHVGETQFGAGVFYNYVCVDRELLVRNLDGDKAKAQQALSALLEATCCVSPRGKQNSFASRAYASYALVEKGNRQPRSLSVAFLDPVRRGDYLAEAVRRLEDTRQAMDRAYGMSATDSLAMSVTSGKVTLEDLKAFIGR